MIVIAAKNQGPKRSQGITALVIHTTDGPQVRDAAKNTAEWFRSQPKRGEKYQGRVWGGSSANYVVDSTQVVQCVSDEIEAWHAGPMNRCSIGIELVGKLGTDWGNEYSLAVLANASRLCWELCQKYGIPIIRLTAADLEEGDRAGICGHDDVTKGLKWGDHLDPGPNFPWDSFMAQIADHLP